MAYCGDWLRLMPGRVGRRWLGAALVLTVLFPVLVLLNGATADNTPFLGGWHWQSAFWSVTETLLGIAWSLGLIYLFRRFADRTSKLGAFLVANAYGAYLIHEPVIVFMALGLISVSLYPLLKFGIVALLGISLCFMLGWLLRRLPYADRVL